MNEPKPFASLSPSLLARKGGARPAMRPQYQAYAPAAPQFHEAIARHGEEDLGWNDMGHEEPSRPEAEILALKPSAPLVPPSVPVARLAEAAKAPEAAKVPEAVKVPEVVRQQAEIADRVTEIAAARPASPSPQVARAAAEVTRRSALATGRRAAFTLRLDAERHLKLRLACTISNRSAQQVVTDALDLFIANLPDVAELAAQVRKRG